MYNKEQNIFKMRVCLAGIIISILMLLLCYNILGFKKGNENTEIVLFVGSGEGKVYTNPDWYRINESGIAFQKNGEQIIAGKNYEVRITLKGTNY